MSVEFGSKNSRISYLLDEHFYSTEVDTVTSGMYSETIAFT